MKNIFDHETRRQQAQNFCIVHATTISCTQNSRMTILSNWFEFYRRMGCRKYECVDKAYNITALQCTWNCSSEHNLFEINYM